MVGGGWGTRIVKLKSMITVVPQWPYLVLVEGALRLEEPVTGSATEQVGDWCGEWGSYVDEHGKVRGVRLMFFLANIPQVSEVLRASNTREEGGDFLVLFQDRRLDDVDGCPFLPVYHAARPDGREILQLSGYK